MDQLDLDGKIIGDESLVSPSINDGYLTVQRLLPI